MDQTRKAESRISCFQVNLQHSRAAVANLCAELKLVKRFVCFLQEPWVCRGKVQGLTGDFKTFVGGEAERPRACVLIANGLTGWLLPQFTSGDTVAVLIKLPTGGGGGSRLWKSGRSSWL